MDGQLIFGIFSNLFLQTNTSWPYMLASALYMAGLWGVFRKSGIEGWWALIPCAREIKLGQAAGMEKEGRVAAIGRLCSILAGLAMTIVSHILSKGLVGIDLENIPEEMLEHIINTLLLFEVLDIIVWLFLNIYLARVYLGLCEVYGRTKWCSAIRFPR